VGSSDLPDLVEFCGKEHLAMAGAVDEVIELCGE
jgi:hypothetical protein